MKFHTPQNIPGASSETTKVALDTKQKQTKKMKMDSSTGVIQVSRSRQIPKWFEKSLLAPFLILKYLHKHNFLSKV